MTMTLTIEQWLTGRVDFRIPQETLLTILFDNGLTAGTAVTSVSEKQRELALADLYLWLSSSSSSSSGELISDGGWQKQVSAKNVVDRQGYKARARQLYLKWGSDKAAAVGGGIVLKDLY